MLAGNLLGFRFNAAGCRFRIRGRPFVRLSFCLFLRGERAYGPAFPMRIISPFFGIGPVILSVELRGRFGIQTVLLLLFFLVALPCPAITFRYC